MEVQQEASRAKQAWDLISRYMRSQKGSTNYIESKMVMRRIRPYKHNKLDAEEQIELRKVLISQLILNKLANQ